MWLSMMMKVGLPVSFLNDWNALRNAAMAALRKAFQSFKKETGKPTFIIIDSHIGYGAPNKQDTHQAHGEPLGDDEIKLTKKFYGWPEDARFFIPEGVKE